MADLPDGSWLAHLRRRTPAAERNRTPITARIIDYTVDDERDQPTVYRLATTLTDPSQVSAAELAAAYTRRWEIEMVFRRAQTHQRSPGWCFGRNLPSWCSNLGSPVLSLRHPDLVGPGSNVSSGYRSGAGQLTLLPMNTRQTLAQAGGTPPDQPSQPGWAAMITRLCRRLLPPRRPRSNPRGHQTQGLQMTPSSTGPTATTPNRPIRPSTPSTQR